MGGNRKREFVDRYKIVVGLADPLQLNRHHRNERTESRETRRGPIFSRKPGKSVRPDHLGVFLPRVDMHHPAEKLRIEDAARLVAGLPSRDAAHAELLPIDL